MFSENIASAIRYHGADLYILTANESRHRKAPFIEKVTQYMDNTADISESFRKALTELSFSCGLSQEDKAVILQFAEKLGTTDTEGQIRHCQYFQKIFSENAEALKNECLTKSKLYRSLGFFSGLALAVVLV